MVLLSLEAILYYLYETLDDKTEIATVHSYNTELKLNCMQWNHIVNYIRRFYNIHVVMIDTFN